MQKSHDINILKNRQPAVLRYPPIQHTAYPKDPCKADKQLLCVSADRHQKQDHKHHQKIRQKLQSQKQDNALSKLRLHAGADKAAYGLQTCMQIPQSVKSPRHQYIFQI